MLKDYSASSPALLADPVPSLGSGAIGAAADAALFALLNHLSEEGYRFVTPTPATHARVVARGDRKIGRGHRDLLGWSLPVVAESVAPEIVQWLDIAGMLQRARGLISSRLRVSTLGAVPFLHSAYPTDAEDAVFFGPDSYRFADLIERSLEAMPYRPGARIVDIGTGAGVGAVVAARKWPGAQLIVTDVNPLALRLSAINAAAAGVVVEPVLAADLAGIEGRLDVALANPPYIVDPAGRAYRDGGAMHGGAVALDMARMAMARLAPGGRLILYTGSAIVRSADPLADALRAAVQVNGCTMAYREIDPDVFGEELEGPAYADVDRIAVVAATIDKTKAAGG